MNRLTGGSIAALALILAGCGGGNSGNSAAGGSGDYAQAEANRNAPLPQIAPTNGAWVTTLAETPEGGYRVGNPDAPVKLIEYGSISCPHCAQFAADAQDRLLNTYVASGQVSWEFRPVVRNAPDLALFTLLRCQGPGPFFTLSHQLFGQQETWMTQLSQAPQAQLAAVESMPLAQRLQTITRLTGVDQFFRQRGMPQGRIDACLADQAAVDRLMQINQVSQDAQIPGTPAFFINGEMLRNVGDWRQLEVRLRDVIGS